MTYEIIGEEFRDSDEGEGGDWGGSRRSLDDLQERM